MELNEIPITNSRVPLNTGSNSTHIPTNDDEVRHELRKLGEPITYFGEDKAARRERLIKLVQEAPNTNFDYAYIEGTGSDVEMVEDDEDEDEDEDFYTPGTQDLYDARLRILKYSLKEATARHEWLQKRYEHQDLERLLQFRRKINASLAKYELFGSQLIPGNTRAVSTVRFSGNGDSYIACSSWDGSISILSREDLTTKNRLVGYHTEKVTLDWYDEVLASGGNEGTLNLWKDPTSAQVKKPTVSVKSAHEQRISKVLFHPSGDYIATTSYDQTWKLWDVNKPQIALVQQEGHSKEVFAGAFHPDGGLFISGGLDGIVRVWDLRSGRSIATLDKHIAGVYSTAWAPNGHHLATASGDCSVKIWDFRNLRKDELFSIPAHTKLVSEVRFFQKSTGGKLVPSQDHDDESGTFLVSSSYDGSINIWSADNWVKVKSLQGHDGKVMSCDIAADGTNIVSGGWDRSVKLWSLE